MSKLSAIKNKISKMSFKRRLILAIIALMLLGMGTVGLALNQGSGDSPVEVAKADQKPVEQKDEASTAVQGATTKEPAPTPAPSSVTKQPKSSAKAKSKPAPRAKLAARPSGNQAGGSTGTVNTPGFTVTVNEAEAYVDDYGQLYFPFEVTFVNGYTADENKPFNLPAVEFVSGPDETAMSPTGMFGKNQPNLPNGGMSGFIGFVVYDHVVAGDYAWKVTVTDGELTASATFVVSLIESEE